MAISVNSLILAKKDNAFTLDIAVYCALYVDTVTLLSNEYISLEGCHRNFSTIPMKWAEKEKIMAF